MDRQCDSIDEIGVFDIVVIGAGPAGCAVASRVADARPNWRIALIEAGRKQGNILTSTPVALAAHLAKPNQYNYGYETVEQSSLNGRRGYQPRGRGVGGSSLINAMVYIRGQAEDYKSWAELGCTSWDWPDVLPYFRRSEDNVRGENVYHGVGGPLHIDDLHHINPMTDAFISAALKVGHIENGDFNGAMQEGVGRYQVFQKNGRRFDAGSAYIHSKVRSNLHVIPNCIARKIECKDGVANSVIVDIDGVESRIISNSEIIISCGAFGSPEILMKSGIGDANELQKLGILVAVDRYEVGKNLQDHLDYIASRILSAPGAMGYTPAALLTLLAGIVPYVRRGTGPMSSNIAEAGGFVRSDASIDRPDIQYHFGVALVDDHARRFHASTGVSLHACHLRPKSRGSVRLSASGELIIDPNYLDHPDDLRAMVAGARLAERILDQEPFARYGGRPLYETGSTDEDIADSIRNRADTAYHPVGTCRMGSDMQSVVDTKLRVRGIARLRVADASIMPLLVSGNTQAPSAMIGERCADFILEE